MPKPPQNTSVSSLFISRSPRESLHVFFPCLSSKPSTLLFFVFIFICWFYEPAQLTGGGKGPGFGHKQVFNLLTLHNTFCTALGQLWWCWCVKVLWPSLHCLMCKTNLIFTPGREKSNYTICFCCSQVPRVRASVCVV